MFKSYDKCGLPEQSKVTWINASSKGAKKWPNLLIPFLSPKDLEKAFPSAIPTSSFVWFKH